MDIASKRGLVVSDLRLAMARVSPPEKELPGAGDSDNRL